MTQNMKTYGALTEGYDGGQLYYPLLLAATFAGVDVVDALDKYLDDDVHPALRAEFDNVFERVFGPEFGDEEIRGVITDFIDERDA